MKRGVEARLRRSEGGYALIEVLISALIVVLVTGAVIQTLVASGHASANERHRSQAYAVAQEDQARLRSMQISKLQQGLAPHAVTLNGTTYSVTSAATYVSAKTGATTCSGEGRADYVRIASSVTWPQMIEGAAPVSIESIVSPTTGSVDATSGGLAIFARNAEGKGLPGVGLNGSGPGSFSGSTNFEGCALFGGLPGGEYTVTPTLGPGWIEPSGEPPQQFSAFVSGGSTLSKELQYGQAGTATIAFSARNRSTGLFETSTAATNMIVRTDSIVLSNNGPPIVVRTWGAPGGAAQTAIKATSVFPFPSPYSVVAGSCAAPPKEEALQPEAAAKASATVPSGGGNVNATVKLPTLYTTVYRTVGVKKEPVANVPVKITDLHCKDSGGTLVTRSFRTIANGGLGENVTGPILETPGLPTGEYEVCAYNATALNHIAAKVLVKSVNGTALSLELGGKERTGGVPMTWLRNRIQYVRAQDGESGITLIELMVAMAAGLIVMAAISVAMLTTIRETGRVTSHVEANQRARLAMTRMVRELNSACFFPRVTPVQEGSDASALIFLRADGAEGETVAPTPVRTAIELTGGDLLQRDTKPSGGGGMTWTFPKAASAEEVLLKSVSPVSGTTPIFTYYSYENGQISPTPLPTPLTKSDAGRAVQVDLAFSASPEPPIQEDENAATAISDSVLLRLTPPSYITSTDNPPCE